MSILLLHFLETKTNIEMFGLGRQAYYFESENVHYLLQHRLEKLLLRSHLALLRMLIFTDCLIFNLWGVVVVIITQDPISNWCRLKVFASSRHLLFLTSIRTYQMPLLNMFRIKQTLNSLTHIPFVGFSPPFIRIYGGLEFRFLNGSTI